MNTLKNKSWVWFEFVMLMQEFSFSFWYRNFFWYFRQKKLSDASFCLITISCVRTLPEKKEKTGKYYSRMRIELETLIEKLKKQQQKNTPSRGLRLNLVLTKMEVQEHILCWLDVSVVVPFWALCVCSSICLSLSISSSFSRSIRSFSFSACSRFFFSFSSCALWKQHTAKPLIYLLII